MSMLDDVAAYLTANSTAFSVGGTTGTVAVGQMLDTQPDTVIALYIQPGLPNAYSFSTGNPIDVEYERPNLQILSRSTSPTVAETRINQAYGLLDGLTNTTIAGTRYLEFEAVQAPFQIGSDDNQRHLWSLNFNVKKDVG